MLKQATTALITDYEAFLCDLLGPESSQGSPQESVLTEYYALRDFGAIKARHDSGVLSVALLSLTKSGKSTFLNALLGRDCMPMGTVPETARICRIVHDRTAAEPVLTDGDDTVEGSAAVRRRLHELNDEVRQREHCLFDEEPLSIAAPLAALADQPPIPTELHLLDTPGPNEAGEEGLRYQVERLLDGVGVLVYLLDCSKLKTQEEEQMFRRLQEINPQLLQRLSKRLFFLVNKKDVLSDDDMSERDVQEYVASLVTAQMGRGDFQLDPDHVMLMSAKTALYSRMVMSGTADEQQMQTFAKLAFGAYGSKKKTPEECMEAAPVLMEESGMEEVEERLLTFLYSHSGRIQLLGTLDDVSRHISRVWNTLAASEAALKKDFNELKERVAGMTRQLETVQGRFGEVTARTAELESAVTDDITARMQTLKERLFEQVDAVLSQPPDAASAPPPRLKPQWQSLWGKIREILGQGPGGPEHQRVNDAQNRLADLYLCVNVQVEAEVRAFWHELEAAAASRQQSLFGIVNEKLQELAAEAEGVLSHRLDVRLEPVDLSIQAPSFAQQHTDFSELFSQGIVRKETEREEVQEVASTVIEKHYTIPLCRFGEYYVARPVTTRETLKIKETNVEVDAEKVKGFFMGHINGMVDASVRSVRAVVQRVVRQRVEAAKKRLSAYCESFQAEMRSALDEGVEGEEERRAALGVASGRSAALKDLRSRLELLVEGAEDAGTDEEEEMMTEGSVVMVGEEEEDEVEEEEDALGAVEGEAGDLEKNFDHVEASVEAEDVGDGVQADSHADEEVKKEEAVEEKEVEKEIAEEIEKESEEEDGDDDVFLDVEEKEEHVEEEDGEEETVGGDGTQAASAAPVAEVPDAQAGNNNEEATAFSAGDAVCKEEVKIAMEELLMAAAGAEADDDDEGPAAVVPVIQMSPLPLSSSCFSVGSSSSANCGGGPTPLSASAHDLGGTKFDYEEGFKGLAASTYKPAADESDEEEGFVFVG